jgi:hypothetical protein
LKLRNGVLGIGDGDEVIHSDETVHEGWEREEEVTQGVELKIKQTLKLALLNYGADACDGS